VRHFAISVENSSISGLVLQK